MHGLLAQAVYRLLRALHCFVFVVGSPTYSTSCLGSYIRRLMTEGRCGQESKVLRNLAVSLLAGL